MPPGVVTTDRSLSDITLHPSGRMYGCNFSNRTIYEVDLMTGQTNAIVAISEANRLVGMTADANGMPIPKSAFDTPWLPVLKPQ